eukprot:CAMPEP_0183734658 /NCGR_PEP_ID=MMETSP0737-20130205/44426_1 /TAXON_ID=385413 /ORGANISM="Thalassiosira miniscula, Strain CCMP1093" /LENGTH=61 /DNA_ID=CAMNT_0025968207 /DNA_START=1145 /DNA_END=1330 /DNA_ORIENTATION=-
MQLQPGSLDPAAGYGTVPGSSDSAAGYSANTTTMHQIMVILWNCGLASDKATGYHVDEARN